MTRDPIDELAALPPPTPPPLAGALEAGRRLERR